MTRLTPLHDIHISLGATLTEFAGWSMPVRYTSETTEHVAVRTAAGLFDLCHMGEVEIAGPGAADALDHALVSRVSQIGIGRAKYTMVCDHDGGILDDLVVYRLAEQRFLVVANASNTSVVVGVLRERATDFDAVVRDVSAQWALIAVQGPAAAAIVDGLTELVVDDLKYYAIDEGTLAGFPVLLARTGYTGEDGFEVYCAAGDAVGVWIALASAGEEHALVPAGLACRDTLRLEAGMALYGHELTRAVTPFEAGLSRIVNFEKPDGFAGQEALLRRREEGAKESLVGLKGEGRRSPRSGYAVTDPDSGEVVGRVTSGAPSPTLGHTIAIAYVRSGLASVGTRLAVDVRGSLEPVEVVPLPFYQRSN